MPVTPPASHRFAATLSPWWCGLGVALAAAIAYHNSLHGPLVFDDATSIVTNPSIQHLSSLGDVLAGPATNVTAQGRPVLNLSLAINYALHGTTVEGYHVFNLIIHALAGLALFGVVRRTLLWRNDERATPIAFVVALLWTVHPLQTESVTYIIQRAESLVGLFYLLTLYGFARGATEARPGRWQVLSVVACLLGMATKEVMATAPLMVLFFDRCLFSGTFAQAWRSRRGYYLALASTWVLLAWLIMRTGGNRGGSVGFGVGVAWWAYWLTQFKAVAHYVWLAVWPHPLVFEYGVFWVRGFGEIFGPMLVVLTLLGGTLVALRKWPAFGFLGACFFGILAPTSLAPGTTQMIVEHRMYLPLAAVLVAMVLGVGAVLRTRGPWLVAALAAMLLTVQRNEVYRSDLALWRDTLAQRPNNPLAHFMLAGLQQGAGDVAGAQASYARTLELKPDFSVGHEYYGEFLLRQGRNAEAIKHLEAALQLQPDYADAHMNLGNALVMEGRLPEGIAHLARATVLMPDSAFTHYNLGNALSEAGRPAEAITHYEAAVKLRPNYAAAYYQLGNTLALSRRPREAVPQYEAALRAKPDYAEAHYNLATALTELGRLPEAVEHYEQTLRLAPDFPNARASLERVRSRMR